MSQKEQQKVSKTTKKVTQSTEKKVTAKRSPKKTIAEQTAEFLAVNPEFLSDFLSQNEELISQIKFAHQTKDSISLHGRQLQILHYKNLALNEQKQQMLQLAAINEKLFHQTTFLVLQLIAAKNLKEVHKILLQHFWQHSQRENCYCLQFDEDLEQELKEKCPNLFLAFKVENKANVFADFNCDELMFLLQSSFIFDVFDPTFHEPEEEQELAKTLPVLVAPLKKDEQIIGLFSVPIFKQKQADPEQGTLFFDFLVQVLNIVCLPFLNPSNQKQGKQQIFWQEMFESCAAKLAAPAPILLNDLLKIIFELSKTQNSGFKCEHLTVIYNDSNTIYKNGKGLNEQNGSVVPPFVTQKLSLNQMPPSLLKKLSTYPEVIVGKLKETEAEFLGLRSQEAKSALIMPIWQQEELVALFYWTNPAADFYSKKNAGSYPQKIANLLQQIAPKFIRLENKAHYFLQQQLKTYDYFVKDELFSLREGFGLLLNLQPYEYRGFKCASYYYYLYPYDSGLNHTLSAECPEQITNKLEVPACLHAHIAQRAKFIITAPSAELTAFLFPVEYKTFADSIEPQPKSILIIPIYSKTGELAAIFYFASETPYYYYFDDAQNESLNSLYSYLNQQLSKFIAIN